MIYNFYLKYVYLFCKEIDFLSFNFHVLIIPDNLH